MKNDKQKKSISDNAAFSQPRLEEVHFTRDMPDQEGALLCLFHAAEGSFTAKSHALAPPFDLLAEKAASLEGFTGKEEQTLYVCAPHDSALAGVVLQGLGDAKDEQASAMLAAGRALGCALAHKRKHVILRAPKGMDAQETAEMALGALLRCYDFSLYRHKSAERNTVMPEKITVCCADPEAADHAFSGLRPLALGVFLARDLVSEPPNILHPESYAKRCGALRALGLEVNILDEEAMHKEGMRALLGVGQGSVRGSRLVCMHWNGAPAQKPLALVGKGVCFDTGGISLKPAGGMEDMKWDMGGSAAVVGVMASLALRNAPVNAVGVIGLVENMPDGNAQRPGDVVETMAGHTVEVLNTDAEGRLVLADAMCYTQKTYSPDVMIDLATLTGAIIVALGNEQAGHFSNDESLRQALYDCGREVAEPSWPLPITAEHREAIRSPIADIKNIGKGRAAGSCSAAAFLEAFVKDDTAWAHIDIAGVAWSDKNRPLHGKGGVGFGVRLLDRYIRKHREQ